MFNLMDTIGRYSGGKWFISRKLFIIWQWFRVLQVILFILVAFKFQDAFSGTFGDVFKLVNTLSFALGNGYLQTLSCIWAPNEVEDEAQGNLGLLLGEAINIGIVTGGVIQVLLQLLG